MNLHPQGDLQGDPVRLPKVTAEHLKYAVHTWGMFCSKMKEGVTRMRFIHLNKVDHQTDVAAEVLVRRGVKCRETERGEERSRQGDGKGFSAVNTMFFSQHQSSE